MGGGLIEEIVGKPYEEYLEEILQIKQQNLDMYLGGLKVIMDNQTTYEGTSDEVTSIPVIDYDKDLATVSFVGMQEMTEKLKKLTDGYVGESEMTKEPSSSNQQEH